MELCCRGQRSSSRAHHLQEVDVEVDDGEVIEVRGDGAREEAVCGGVVVLGIGEEARVRCEVVAVIGVCRDGLLVEGFCTDVVVALGLEKGGVVAEDICVDSALGRVRGLGCGVWGSRPRSWS